MVLNPPEGLLSKKNAMQRIADGQPPDAAATSLACRRDFVFGGMEAAEAEEAGVTLEIRAALGAGVTAEAPVDAPERPRLPATPRAAPLEGVSGPLRAFAACGVLGGRPLMTLLAAGMSGETLEQRLAPAR